VGRSQRLFLYEECSPRPLGFTEIPKAGSSLQQLDQPAVANPSKWQSLLALFVGVLPNLAQSDYLSGGQFGTIVEAISFDKFSKLRPGCWKDNSPAIAQQEQVVAEE
jgi:hypothetical protein